MLYFIKRCILFYHVTHAFSYLIFTEYMEKHQGIIEGCHMLLLFSELSAHVSVISDALTIKSAICLTKKKKTNEILYYTFIDFITPLLGVFFLN